jgi:hypothetical protein
MVSARNLVTPTSTYSIQVGDSMVMASGTFTVTLPTSTTYGVGRVLYISNYYYPTADGTITLAAQPGEYIDGVLSATITLKQYQSIALVVVATNGWKRLDQPAQVGWSDFTTLGGTFGSYWTEIYGYEVYLLKDSLGFVNCTGAISCTTGSTTIATFPAGYRPDKDTLAWGYKKNSTGIMYELGLSPAGVLTTNGGITPATSDMVIFDMLRFKAA